MTEVDDAVAAIQAGQLVVLPTDTVYGLACTAEREEPARRLYRLKGREEIQPTALVASSLDWLLESVPELRGRGETIARTLLPGPYTLVLSNPSQRFRWLSGARPDTIGVRVPDLSGAGAEVLGRVGAIVATSANLPGGPDPCRLDEVPPEILAGVVATVDAGELPGRASTVIDFTGPVPAVIRHGAADAVDALGRVALRLP